MVSYGFYDSFNHDRRYNALQFGSMFDGIIQDGIFMSIGTCFRVIPAEGMMVLVGIGRAWFDHTWTFNDAPLPIYLPQSELLLNRIDAIVIDVNATTINRKNDIIVVKGTPSSNPQRPELINTATRHQYPLAYITVNANVTEIRAADITSMIGTSESPYVTGILDTVNIDALLDQWEDQWQKFFEDQTDEMDETAKYWKDLWHQWYHMYTDSSTEEFDNWKAQQKAEFISWFNELKDILSGEVEAVLADKIEQLEKRSETLEKFKRDLTYDHAIYTPIQDSNGDIITDNVGDQIDGRIIFVTL